jgi:hypothetical protein
MSQQRPFTMVVPVIHQSLLVGAGEVREFAYCERRTGGGFHVPFSASGFGA